MSDSTRVVNVVRFGSFELDTRSGELRKNGARVRLQEQPGRLLAILLRKQGEMVSREELREQLWASDTFVDFDHGLNAAMRKLRAALHDSAETPRFIETVARRGYRFIAPVEWIGGEGRIPAKARGLRLWSSLALLFIAAIAAIALYVNRAPRDPHPPRAIAVLPFTNTDPNTEFVSDGLTELLINELSKWRELRVMARTTAFQYKGKSIEPREIGRKLNVDAILTGALRRTPGQYQLTVELIDVRDGAQLWGTQVRGSISEVAGVQHALADGVTERLGLPRSTRPRRVPQTSPAYPYYLRGMHYWHKRNKEDVLQAIEYFNRALEIDPAFAPGHAGLSLSYGVMSGNGQMPRREGTLEAKAAAERALALDDTNAEAWTSLAAGKCSYFYDFAGAERDFRHAIALNPGYASAHQWFSGCLTAMGRLAEARKEIEIAHQLDPLSGPVLGYFCGMFFVERRFEEAITCARRGAELNPEDFRPRLIVIPAYFELGQYEKGFAEMRAAEGWRGKAADEYAKAYARGGRRAFRLKQAEVWLRHEEDKRAPGQMAMLYAQAGEADKAFEYLEKAFEARAGVEGFYVEPRFDNIRSDPRFDALARRVGLPQVQGSSR